MGCRNVEAGLRVRDEIRAETGNGEIMVKELDLASQQSIRRFADEIKKGKIHEWLCNLAACEWNLEQTEGILLST